MTRGAGSSERADRLVGHFVQAGGAGGAEARHRRVERDAVDPRRQRGVAAEGVDLVAHLHQHVLHHFLRVFLVAGVAERELVHPGAVVAGQLGHGRVVAGLEAFDESGCRRVLVTGSSSFVCRNEPRATTPYSRGRGARIPADRRPDDAARAGSVLVQQAPDHRRAGQRRRDAQRRAGRPARPWPVGGGRRAPARAAAGAARRLLHLDTTRRPMTTVTVKAVSSAST